MRIQAVIFDMDGVLLDSEPFHDETNLSILRSYGIEADRSVTNPYIGRTGEALWEGLKASYPQIETSVQDLINLQWDINVKNIGQSGIGPSEGLSELLAYLERVGIRATVASSSKRAFVEAVLDHLRIRSKMEGFTTGEEVAKSKPAPDIFLLAADKLGVEPEACLVIEDSTAGVRAGKTAGMFTVGYLNPTSDGQDISAADVVVTRLIDTIGVIKRLG